MPHAGLALARGWYRQLDIADNPALYARQLAPADYRAWLRRRAVRFVVLTGVGPAASEETGRESDGCDIDDPSSSESWQSGRAHVAQGTLTLCTRPRTVPHARHISIREPCHPRS